MIYKVSYVVDDGKLPGSIKNEPKRPQIGDMVRVGLHTMRVVKVQEVMPARGEFLFLHATVQLVAEQQQASSGA